MLSKGQIRLIHVAKDRLGLGYEEYREILALYGGARSSTELSPEGFFRVMEHFRELGFETREAYHAGRAPEEKGRDKANVVEMVTPAQMALIRSLESRLGWSDNPERLGGFISKRLGIRRISTKAQAIKVIEALKAMLARRDKKTGT